MRRWIPSVTIFVSNLEGAEKKLQVIERIPTSEIELCRTPAPATPGQV